MLSVLLLLAGTALAGSMMEQEGKTGMESDTEMMEQEKPMESEGEAMGNENMMKDEEGMEESKGTGMDPADAGSTMQEEGMKSDTEAK